MSKTFWPIWPQNEYCELYNDQRTLLITIEKKYINALSPLVPIRLIQHFYFHVFKYINLYTLVLFKNDKSP